MSKNFGRRYAFLGAGAHATATGTTLSSTPVFDITGFSGVAALMTCQVTATNNGLVCRIGTASGSLSDLAGTWTTAQATALLLEVWKPSGGQFVNFQYRQGTSGQHSPIFVFGIGAESRPTTNSSMVYKHVNCPVTGTATSS